jgi:hypothetical protein
MAMHRSDVVTVLRGADGREIRFQPGWSESIDVPEPVMLTAEVPERAVAMLIEDWAVRFPVPNASRVRVVEPVVTCAADRSCVLKLLRLALQFPW